MNASSFARNSLVAASLCAAFAATGCIAADGDDFDDEDHDATEEALSATNATNITAIATSAGKNALGAVGGAAFTKVLGAFGIYGTSNISKASMQEIASLVGTTVRGEFLNTYEADLHAAYDASDVYSRTCTTAATCKNVVVTLQNEAWDIYNDANRVAEYYKLDSLSKDRLTVAPQLVNALTLKSSFLMERYELYKLQAPSGNNSAYRTAACNSGKSAVTVLNAVEGQFNQYIDAKFGPIQTFYSPPYVNYPTKYCYDAKCTYSYSETRAKREAEKAAVAAQERPKILGNNFNSARTQLTQMGNICK
jgi:hypothetical protein